MQLALIVDDSKTARVLLRRMLEKIHIPSVMVESGEQALEYLKNNRPDVIFMDHMMPGMDGFAAVKAIKADPDKASIPIIMHTTQQGDIYVGQARALGAIDILSKPTTDQDLLQVLERVIQSSEQPANTELHSHAHEDTAEHADAHAANVKTNTLEMPALDYVPSSDRPFFQGAKRQWLMVLVWLIPFIWLLSLSISQQNEIDNLHQDKSHLYKSIEWLANQQGGYDYGEMPMSERRLDMLSTLLPMLQRAGFKGVVRLEGHVGEFCLSQLKLEDGSEVLMLPKPELGLSECDVIGTSAVRAMAMSIGQGPAFRDFMQDFHSQTRDILIELVPYGASAPRYSYPDDITRISTGDWNTIAMSNNRVNVVLVEKR